MKTVKELCLGVAVAGAVAGAGSALGCAVANATTDDAGRGDGASATNTSSASESASRNGKAGPTRQPSRLAAAAAGTQQSSETSGRAAGGVGRVPLPSASATTVRASSASRSASVTTSPLADIPPTHVLLIGTDGTNLSKVLADPANVGFFDLMDQSVTGATSLVGHTTISGPSWTTILTGVWDDKSGVFNNIFNPRPYIAWPTVFNLLEYNRPGIRTSAIADWQYINDIAEAGGWAVDNSVFVPQVAGDTDWSKTDLKVVQDTIKLIGETAANESAFIFSYQVQVDEVGHLYGAASPQFAKAINNVSDNIAAMMTAVDAWETQTGEDWTVIVTTDHGHQMSVGFGHGFQSPNETTSFVIFDQAGDQANDGNQNLAFSNVDITPTIVNLFGVPPRSDFDGIPLQSKTTGIVTPVDLKQALRDQVAMYGYPNIGVDVALGVRTVAGAVPYFLNGFVNQITGFLQGVVDQQIFLISQLAGVAEFAVDLVGGALVGLTQAMAGVVATLTGSGVIPPTDQPLPPPSSASLLPAATVPASVLV